MERAVPSGSCRPDGAAVAALVSRSGQVSEVGDSRGRRLLEQHPALLGFARALLEAPVDLVRFVWVDPSRAWHAAAVRRTAEGTALVEAAVVEPAYDLTLRELDVLTLMAGGLSNAEVAGHLGASVRTITTHAQRILGKLDQSTRAGAAGLAIEHGLLRLPVPGGGRSIGMLAAGIVDQLAAGRPVAPVRVPPPAHPRGHARPRPFLIGSALPLSGAARADGLEMRRGSELAIAEINERGGIAGRPVEQVVVDTDICTLEGTREAFRRLVDLEVDAITTGYSFVSDPVRYREVSDYGCPLLNTMTLERETQWVRDDRTALGNVFQVGPTELHYGDACVRFLDRLRASGAWTPRSRRLFFIESAAPAGRIADAMALTHAERSGWDVDALFLTDLLDTDWDPVLAAIDRSCPAVVVVSHPFAEALATFQRRLVATGAESLVYAVYTPSVPAYLEAAGEAAEGVLWSTVTGVYHDRLGAAFADRYRQRFGVTPGRSQAGLSYDQVGLLTNAWARAGNPRAFEAVAGELRRMTHRGVNGMYHLGHERQCGLGYPHDTPDPALGQAHLVHQVQDGRHRILDPAPYADSVFRAPPDSPSR